MCDVKVHLLEGVIRIMKSRIGIHIHRQKRTNSGYPRDYVVDRKLEDHKAQKADLEQQREIWARQRTIARETEARLVARRPAC